MCGEADTPHLLPKEKESERLAFFHWPNDPEVSEDYCSSMNVPPSELAKKNCYICSRHFGKCSVGALYLKNKK